MLNIRSEQMQLFDQIAKEEFTRRLVQHWQYQITETNMRDSYEIDQLAKNFVEQAYDKGLRTEQEIVTFADIALVMRIDHGKGHQL